MPSEEIENGLSREGSDTNQGRASFVAGATTGGGSNFGQGSHQLGGGSYQQGSTKSAGSNYDNEAGRLGDSSVGSAEEATAKEASDTQGINAGNSARESDTPLSGEENRGKGEEKPSPAREGDRRDTSLEKASNLQNDNTTHSSRSESGGWSDASTGSEL